MYSVVDCSTAEYQVFHFEPNNLGVANCLIPHHRSFDEYTIAWLDGIDLMNDVFPGDRDP